MRIMITMMMVCTCVMGMYAQEPKDQLLKKVELLEARVKALEKMILGNHSNGKQLAPEIQQWRKLRKGMRPGEVRELLGEPERIEGGFQTYWYYLSNEAVGYVVFNNYDKVNGWREPY
jgi:outer membrane protein assembly factor BamE (lipoprotein component of BamABCDE complex)